MIDLSAHVHKKGIRVLGVSESFVKGRSQHSILAGIVMRGDLIVDGFTFSRAKVGGLDATHSIIEMYRTLGRDDVNIILLNGCVISWYNVVDLNRVCEETGIPLICVTYDDSEGLEAYFKEYFPESWKERVDVYRKNGPRTPLTLQTNHVAYVRFINITEEETLRLLNKFTLHGAIAEPLRAARLLARSLMKSVLLPKDIHKTV